MGPVPQVLDYTGPLDAPNLKQFLTQVQAAADGTSPMTAPAGGEASHPVGVAHLKDAAAWEAQCSAGVGLCAVAFLPRLRQGEQPPAVPQLVAAQQQLGTAAPVRWAWAAAEGNEKLMAALDLSADAGFAVLSPRKGRAAAYRGRLQAEALVEFVQGVLSGRTPTAAVGALPPLQEEGAPPQAEAEPPAEDEFDLSEVCRCVALCWGVSRAAEPDD